MFSLRQACTDAQKTHCCTEASIVVEALLLTVFLAQRAIHVNTVFHMLRGHKRHMQNRSYKLPFQDLCIGMGTERCSALVTNL